MQRKTVLITGVAGFIGSNLCEALLQTKKFKVIGIDNFNDYYSPQIKHKNLEFTKGNKNFELYTADILDSNIFETIFNKHQVDVVIHLAARAGVRQSLLEPELYWNTNLIASQNLLEGIKKHHIKHFIFASSSSVYGNRSKGPFKESDSTDSPISPYSASKKALELLAYTYAFQYQIKTTGLRFFNVYGPKNRPDMGPFIFTKAILNDQSITQYGDGLTGRDYTYIDDIVAGVVAAINTPFDFEIINLGNSHPVLLKDMIQTIAKSCQKEVKINILPKQPGEVELTFANNTKAKKLLNWIPKTDFPTGVEKLVEWYKKAYL